MTEGPLIAQLAKHLQRPVPESVRTRARLHLLDWLACVAGARGSEAAEVNRRSKRRDVFRRAAWLGNVLEMDDVHRQALLHPGPVVWPAALMGNGDSLDHILDCAVGGYEAMIAIGASFDKHHYAFYHPTSTAGAFGATAAFGLNWLEGQALPNALALAGSVTGGLWQTRHTANLAKQWHIEHAVGAGADASIFASDGATGPLDILEGPQGVYAATCREPKPMILGSGWRIEEVSFKPWAACRHAHPAIDCALELRAAGKLTPPFHVETYADALAFCDNPSPRTETEAKFSLQHAVAVIASGGDASPADFTLSRIAELADLRVKTVVSEAPEITARYPAHFGARLNGFELTDCRGDPERPVTEADIIAKMHMLAAWGGLTVQDAEKAVELSLHGDDAGAIVAMLEGWLS